MTEIKPLFRMRPPGFERFVDLGGPIIYRCAKPHQG
jgi:hypothetical protein